MDKTLICAITEYCDVEVAKFDGGHTHAIRVKGGSEWAENFHTPEEALAILVTLREAGLKFPPSVTETIAKRIVQRTFNSGRL